MEEWTRESFIFCKEEWLTEECRGVFKNAEAKLTALLQSAIQYRHVQKKKDTKTLLISAWQLNLSEEDIADIENFVTLMHSQNDDKLPTVVLVGFATLRLEHPLQLWSNVVIMSPDVHVSAIDLSAVGQAPGPVLSQNRDNITSLVKSTGQRGGLGQNAGPAVDGVDAVYDLEQFKTSVTQLKRQLPTLEQWGLAERFLSDGFELQSQKKTPAPSDKSSVLVAASITAEVAFIAAGAAAVAGMATSFCESTTKTKLNVVRCSAPGTRGIPPGHRGKGGKGGLGGRFYVMEGGQILRSWYDQTGSDGEHGVTGKRSKDGMASIAVTGTIRQGYNWLGINMANRKSQL
ncbi:hypothetical protein PC121_g7616 [Phytophthora cactorum]|nr:hypothetical protein PC121_g7616 [Phytophthora cactorum]